LCMARRAATHTMLHIEAYGKVGFID